jgi:hypothetical protein
MDPLRRLILLTLVASVVLIEPSQACALLGQRTSHSERDQAVVTQQFIRQLAIVLRQTVKPALQSARKWSEPNVLIANIDFYETRTSRPMLQPHLFDLPPPLG